MSINTIIGSRLFETYNRISTSVKSIQKSDKTMEAKKSLMSQLRKQNEDQLNNYNKVASSFAHSFLKRYPLNDHVIHAKIGSPTPYGNQPKDYLWSGISIDEDKSYSFQYSWVFQKDQLEVTFCFGSGGSSSGKIDSSVREKKETSMRAIEQVFVNLLTESENRSTIERLLQQEGFVLSAEWLNSDKKFLDVESYLIHIRNKTGAKTGITRYFDKDELIVKGFNLEEKLFHYFDIFRPIWDQLHFENPERHQEKNTISDNEMVILKQNTSHISTSEQLRKIKRYIKKRGFQYPEVLVENYYLSLKSKPFVILAGISGTGKSKLVQLFAEAVGANKDNGQYVQIPVRPDWNDPSDLIGFKDLGQIFRPGPLTKVLLEATKPENVQKPHFVCLDEMNLARVEHYFSDVLSILETQEREGDRIVTTKILHKEDFGGSTDLIIPDNVYLIGTVNMDETTHPFSKKVLDRANTIEFNYINLSVNFAVEETDDSKPIVLPNDFFRSDYLQLIDAYKDYKKIVDKYTEELIRVNRILEKIDSHIGFRIRDSVCFFMIYNERFQLISTDEAFDLQFVQKILPRIQGSNDTVKRVLIELMGICWKQDKGVEHFMSNPSELFAPWGRNEEAQPEAKYTHSARKLAYMLRRLDDDGYTSYWLS